MLRGSWLLALGAAALGCNGGVSGLDRASPAPADGGTDVASEAALGSTFPAVGRYALVYAYGAGWPIGELVVGNVSSGKLTSFYSDTHTLDLGASAVQRIGGDEIVLWGRWDNGLDAEAGVTGALHYVLGRPTSAPPASRADWVGLGSTGVTYSDVSVSQGTMTGAFEYDPASRTGHVSITIDMPGDARYSFSTWEIGLGQPGFFRNTGKIDVQVEGSSARACPAVGAADCTAWVTGFFAGEGATRAAVGVTVQGGAGTGTTLLGTAVFAR